METFSALLDLFSTVYSVHKGQWRGTLMFSLICVWTTGWADYRDAGDLRRNRAHYEVTLTCDHEKGNRGVNYDGMLWHAMIYLLPFCVVIQVDASSSPCVSITSSWTSSKTSNRPSSATKRRAYGSWLPGKFARIIQRTATQEYSSSLKCYERTMMTSSNGSIFRVTGPLCGEFTSHWWIPLTKASDAVLGSFFDLRPNKRMSKQSRRRWFKAPSRSLWPHCNANQKWISAESAKIKVTDSTRFFLYIPF